MSFVVTLKRYQQAIDADIAVYTAQTKKVTREQYGEYPSLVTNEYLDLLERGGKRIRGALVMAGYEMVGGQDTQMITRAATAIEVLHAALLVIDDIQDRDEMRRGKPAVHVALAKLHNTLGMKGDAQATGISLALDAGLVGSHMAQALLAELPVDAGLRTKVISIVNIIVVLTLHGQTYDVINAGLAHPKPENLARATEWKSAHYTFLNPLCVGMTLAGGGREDTDAIRGYALHAGIAFQLADDLMDGDVRPREIPAIKAQAAQHVQDALAALDAPSPRWDPTCVAFLRGLAKFAVARKS